MTTPAITAWPPLAGGPAAAHAPALLDWASRQDPDVPRLCLIRGGPGVGKSHLLAWLLAGSGSDPRTVIHATVPAERQIADTLAWELGRQLGYGPLSPAALVARIAADPRPVRILIPDLHKAGRGPADLPAARPPAVVAELVRPLLALPHLRLAVETGSSDLLPAEGAAVLDLGTEPFRTPAVHPAAPPAAAPSMAGGAAVDWRTASAAQREHALDEALAAGTAAELLRDPGFLVHGSPAAITATLADPRIAAPRRLRAVWERAAPALTTDGISDTERAAVLHAAALGSDTRLADFLRPLAHTHHWSSRWSLPHHPTTALTVSRQPASAPAVLTADPAGRLERRRPGDGSLTGRMTTDPKLRPVALAALETDCLLALDAAGHLWPVPAGRASTVPVEADYLPLYHNGITLTSPADRPTAIACDTDRVALGDARGRVHLWCLTRLQAGPRTARPHQGGVTAVACALLRQVGVTLVVSGGLDGAVHLWDSATGEVMPVPVERRAAVPTALAMADTGHGLLLAVAWSDRRLHLWQVFEGRMTSVPLLVDVDALALTADGLAVLGGPAGTSALQLDLAGLWT